MGTASIADEARAFVENYARTFDSCDGDRIAALYHAPCVTMRGDGSIHCLQSREALASFFQGVADTYRRDGYRASRFSNLQVTPIGGRSALVTVDWELLRADGSMIRQWRQSYNLVRVDGGWQILVSTFHVD
jgi:ketosteroid isomerase-like protein